MLVSPIHLHHRVNAITPIYHLSGLFYKLSSALQRRQMFRIRCLLLEYQLLDTMNRLDKENQRDLVRILAEAADSVVRCDATKRPNEYSQSIWSTETTIVPLSEFILDIGSKSGAGLDIYGSTLVCMNELRAVLPRNLCGVRCTAHRIFLGSIIFSFEHSRRNEPPHAPHFWANISKFPVNDVLIIASQVREYLSSGQVLDPAIFRVEEEWTGPPTPPPSPPL